MKKSLNILAITLGATLVIIFCCCSMCLTSAVLVSYVPRSKHIIYRAQSNEENYEIIVREEDYGGTYGSCVLKYGQGLSIFKYYVGRSCGGIQRVAYLKDKDSIIRVYELERLPKVFSYYPGQQSIRMGDPIEKFDYLGNGQIKWYGEIINYQDDNL